MSLITFTEFLAKQATPQFTNSPPAEPSVYYLCSFENFEKICSSGMILPKNAVLKSEDGDLSAASIQSRRTGNLDLGTGQKTFPVVGHNCLNFFLNPHNVTFQAFVRNSMVANCGINEVLILSIPLQKLSAHLSKKNHLFACSDKNVASYRSKTSSIHDDYKKYDWPSIMSTKGNTGPRSAEFILWYNDHTSTSAPSAGLPLALVDTVYLPAGATCTSLASLDVHKAQYNHEWSTKLLFNKAFSFNQYLEWQTPIDYQELMAYFVSLTKKMPFPLSHKSFSNEELAAHYQHGYLHVLKVMLWVAFLSHPKVLPLLLPNEKLCKNIAVDTMFAALIHDLARESNKEDTKHGQNSVKKFSDELLEASNGNLPRLKNIRLAVSEHCKPDSESKDPANIIWRILKDADALDRGRFADPCDAESLSNKTCETSGCRHTGCVHNSLRLDYSKLGGSRQIAEAARHLANLVYSAPISPKSPIDSFRVYVQVSIDQACSLANHFS